MGKREGGFEDFGVDGRIVGVSSRFWGEDGEGWKMEV